jgi:hypothetical protein
MLMHDDIIPETEHFQGEIQQVKKTSTLLVS